jgi:hypothetical protein
MIGQEQGHDITIHSVPKVVDYMKNIWIYAIVLVAIFLIIATASAVLFTDTGESQEAVSPVTSAPEFPSVFLPAVMIIGFLNVVLHIQRTREN